MEKQVNKSHYDFSKYLNKRRWISMWHQLDEVMKLNPGNVLEVGPGPGVFKSAGIALGLNVSTLDIDPELGPDYVGSVFDMHFMDGEFDVVCAFQMLEHIPYEKAISAFKEMVRVARKNVVISLPNSKVLLPFSIFMPKHGVVKFSLPRYLFKAPEVHEFDGEHYWELNKANYSVDTVVRDFVKGTDVKLVNSYRVHENSYHHFFIFEKSRN